MHDLIKIQPQNIGGQTIETVNARELHGFLESSQEFANWIKNRIQQYGFVEGMDYLIDKVVNNPLGGRPIIDYHVSIDTAKELAMVERNEKGRQARQYFIECERRLKTGGSNIPQIETAKYIFEAVGVAADVLRCSDSGRLAMLHKAASPWPLLQAVLPPYAIDAPTGKESEGSKSHAAIKDICQGIMSAVKANKALLKAGLLEQLERPSASAPNGIKTYKSVTAKGLKYGLNVTSQKNVRETQPHWYLETADELIEIIKANGV